MPSSGVQTCALRSEEHTSELQSHDNLVCRLLLEKTKRLSPWPSPPPPREPVTPSPPPVRCCLLLLLCTNLLLLRRRLVGGGERPVLFFFNNTATPELLNLSVPARLPV